MTTHQQQRLTTTTTTTTSIATMKVRFNKVVKMKRIIHINDYTDEEIEACWITPKTYKSIQTGILMTLDLMKLSSSSSSSQSLSSQLPTSSTSLFYCMRGLENLLSGKDQQQYQYDHDQQQLIGSLKESINMLRQNLMAAVLDEVDSQYYQYYATESNKASAVIHYDATKIRDISMKYTGISKENAYFMGRSDAIISNSSISNSSNAKRICALAQSVQECLIGKRDTTIIRRYSDPCVAFSSTTDTDTDTDTDNNNNVYVVDNIEMVTADNYNDNDGNNNITTTTMEKFNKATTESSMFDTTSTTSASSYYSYNDDDIHYENLLIRSKAA